MPTASSELPIAVMVFTVDSITNIKGIDKQDMPRSGYIRVVVSMPHSGYIMENDAIWDDEDAQAACEIFMKDSNKFII